MTWTVHAFYRFVSLPDYQAIRPVLLQRCRELELVGSILLAHEGINATIAGTGEGLKAFWDHLRRDARFTPMEPKVSYVDHQPFKRMKVRLKKEIVTLGITDIDPVSDVGIYVEPSAWNDLIKEPGVVVIDTRNHYEVVAGRFEGAIDPETRSFRAFTRFVESRLDPARDEKIATYCTGGIRCEKATAYLRKKGFKDVYQLRGGILNYLAQVPSDKSLWKGDCFVFDERETLDHNLRSVSPGNR